MEQIENRNTTGDGSRASFQDHFSGVSADYAAFRPRYPAALFAWLASVAPARRLAWDCATGSGQAALGLAAYFERVVATDASRSQIEKAGKHPRIDYRVAPADSSGLGERSVDLVSVAQALHWFERESFFEESRRVLLRGGLIAVWSYGALRVEGKEADRLVQEFYHDVVGPFWPEERALVDSGYREIELPFSSVETPRFTMRVSWTLPELLGYIRTWSATTRFLETHGADPVVHLGEKLSGCWGSADRQRSVNWPLAVLAGRS